MNLELLESFGQNYPEEFDGALDCISLAVTCSFNKHGTLLAVGCNDGRIVIWDFLTRGIAKIICAHVHPVCSLSWSRNGHKLLSASTDNSVCIWDVLNAECEHRYRFPSPILKVQFHPRSDTFDPGSTSSGKLLKKTLNQGQKYSEASNKYLGHSNNKGKKIPNLTRMWRKFLVCPMKHPAVLVQIDGSHSVVPLDDESDLNIVASYDRRGTHVYTGNAKGKILVLSIPDMTLRASFRVTTGTSNTTSIKSIEFARRGDCFLVNTADRVIRVYESREVIACGRDGEPEPIQKLQDLVNKTMWKKCCFSGDGEYVCAGSARQHSLYIWEKSVGNLVKILHGTKGELLLDVVWHPVRPIIASISSGVVSIWAQPQVENWSAFAPDFKELDENVEYEERESEFDIEDEDKSPQLHAEKQEEDEIVDVVTVEPIAAFCSSDEDEDVAALLYLPISPDIDEPEEGWAQAPDMPPDDQSSKRMNGYSDDHLLPKKKRSRTIDVDLADAPKDETHPLLNTKSKEKVGPQAKKSGRPKPHKMNGSTEGKKSKHGGSKGKDKPTVDPFPWKEPEDN